MILNDLGKNGLPQEDAKEELNKESKDDGDAFETVLRYVGELGRYQKWLLVAMAPLGFTYAFVYFVQMFIAATPQRHWCKVPELQHLDLELRRNLSAPRTAEDWDRCHTYNANWSYVLETMVAPEPNTSKVPCRHGWEFELSDIPYHTVVSERGWVCEFAGYAPLAQSMFFAGSFVGGLLFGWVADRFGRVPALVGSNLIGCFGGIASIFTVGLWDFAFCRFLVGISFDSCFMILYILILEFVGSSHRTLAGNMPIALYFGGSSLLLPWLAYWIADWRRLLWITSLPMLVVIVAPLVVPESARWLCSRGRVSEAVQVLKRFEKVNRTKIPQDVMDDFIISSKQTRETDESMMALLKSGPLRTTLAFMVIVYMVCALIFDGLVRMSENLGLDFFLTFTLASATEIPSLTLLVFLLDRWGRRILICGPLTTAGVLSLVAAFVPKGIPQVSLAIMARFCMNISCSGVVQWTTELLPTGVRASGSSLVHVSGYIATVLSPFVVYSKHFWSPLPLLILGVTALVAAGIAVLLPETKGKSMPQTIADGEKLVREHSLCGKREDLKDNNVELIHDEKQMALIT